MVLVVLKPTYVRDIFKYYEFAGNYFRKVYSLPVLWL